MAESETAVPDRPLLSGLYRVVPLGPDRVEVCNAGRSVVLRGTGFAERVMPLLDALDGESTLGELRDRFPELVPAVLEGLTRKGMLVDGETGMGNSAPVAMTAAALGGLSPAVVAERLSGQTVMVLGCGPVAGTAAVHLAKAGVKRLVLSDDGKLTPPEVAVSPLHRGEDTGRPRVEVVRQLCEAAEDVSVEIANGDPRAQIVGDEGLLVIEGRDGSGIPLSPAADAALAAGTPFLVHSQDALEAFVGPYVRPGGEPCHRCAESRRLGHVDNLDEFMAYRRHRAENEPLSDAFLAAHTSLLAGLLSTEVLRILADAPHLTDRSVAVVDLAALRLDREEVLPVPGCPGCATVPGFGADVEIEAPLGSGPDHGQTSAGIAGHGGHRGARGAAV